MSSNELMMAIDQTISQWAGLVTLILLFLGFGITSLKCIKKEERIERLNQQLLDQQEQHEESQLSRKIHQVK